MSEEHTPKESTGADDQSDVQNPGDVNSENGGGIRNAGGSKSGYPQSPRENSVETPVDDEDRDGGESMEKALSSHYREMRQKMGQQRRGAASTEYDSNVSGASGSTGARGTGTNMSPLSRNDAQKHGRGADTDR